MRRYTGIRLICLVAALLLIVATASASVKTNYKRSTLKAGRYGGIFVSGLAGEPLTFNPLFAVDPVSSELLGPVFESLAEVNPDTFEVEPALAEKWSVSRDGLIWSFTLRQGLFWSDGVSVTSDDVVFSIHAFLQTDVTGGWRDKLAAVNLQIQTKRVDAQTVQFILNQPFSCLVSLLPPILPAHILEEPLENGQITTIWSAGSDLDDMVATGPFIPREYRPGTFVIHERNAYHWRADRSKKPLPYGDRWNVRLTPSKPDLVSQFQAGITDWVTIPATEWNNFRKNEASGRYRSIDAGYAMEQIFLVFNQNSQAPPFENNAILSDLFRDRRFRQAISYAVDQDEIIKQVYGGRASERWSVLSPVVKKYASVKVNKYAQSTRRAEALMKEAGLRLERDKILRNASGEPIRFSLAVCKEEPDLMSVANLLAKQLKNIGIQLEIITVSSSELNTALTGTYNWEAALISLPGHPDPETQRSIWHSSGYAHYWHPRQAAPVSSWEATVDQIFERAAATTDTREKTKLFSDWLVLMSEELPVIPMPVPNAFYGVRSRINNAEIPAYGGIIKRIQDLWIGFNP